MNRKQDLFTSTNLLFFCSRIEGSIQLSLQRLCNLVSTSSDNFRIVYHLLQPYVQTIAQFRAILTEIRQKVTRDNLHKVIPKLLNPLLNYVKDPASVSGHKGRFTNLIRTTRTSASLAVAFLAFSPSNKSRPSILNDL